MESDSPRDLAERVGRNIRRLREDKGLSQVDLSKKAGIVQPQISRWERGLNLPQLDGLMKIAHALDIHVSDLYAPDGVEPNGHDTSSAAA